ncbi:MAG: N-glycosylase/DNA lyase [Candidatus Bathyarchaeota archaeon]|nr:N-glycosylase/DNA lyase [Candidatus Bathyarchaeota archaeon]
MAEKVRDLTNNPRVQKMVEERMREFRWVHEQDTQKWYEELVYCLLTANASALMGQKCVDALCCDNIIREGELEDIRSCLKEQGHRFPNVRAEYINNTRHLAPLLKSTIQGFKDSREARVWLVENVKGIGWKEGSHYLRNVGYFDLAIIDRHIISNLMEHGLIGEEGRKSITKKRYFQYEETLDKVAKMLNMLPGELDLYLWYRKTGKVLK